MVLRVDFNRDYSNVTHQFRWGITNPLLSYMTESTVPSSCAEPRTCQAVAVIKMIISRDCVQGNGLDCSKQDFPFPSTLFMKRVWVGGV